MKIILVLMFSLFLGKSCESQTNKDLENAVLEYSANSRGFYLKIVVKNQKFFVSKNRDEKENPIEKTISEADKKELLGYFKTIILDSLPKLKAPSKKRFHDGAAMAHLTVNYKNNEYKTTTFDHGNPPEEIKKLVTKINSFAKKEE